MAKKIEGYVDGTGEGPEFTPYKEGNQYFPFWEAKGITLKPKFDYWRKAVVVVTDERVFTESEVKALVRDITEASRGQWSPPSEGRAIAAKHGIVLDPA